MHKGMEKMGNPNLYILDDHDNNCDNSLRAAGRLLLHVTSRLTFLGKSGGDPALTKTH